eukprot:scaffold2289_cov162-Ochromonas_danica.AAC.3
MSSPVKPSPPIVPTGKDHEVLSKKGSIGMKRGSVTAPRSVKISKKPADRSHLSLPIYNYRQAILDAVKKYQTTIIVGETGSGKSTQLPQILLDGGLARRGQGIVCTQPRRVAAMTIAQKVANERQVDLGQEVGYSIRFEDRSSHRTVIKYATDGVLLRESMTNPTLAHYNIVILDEAHERSLQTDILIGLLKNLLAKRVDDNFRLVIMSATLQVDVFASFFDNSTTVIIPGRQFPVRVMYLKAPESDYVEASLLSCLQIYEEEEEEGGVLVFLPGQEDIESLQQLLIDHLPTTQPRRLQKTNEGLDESATSTDANRDGEKEAVMKNSRTVDEQGVEEVIFEEEEKEKDDAPYAVRVLYAAMPSEEQMQVFQPVSKGVRLFILATNIAETSLTISGVRFVVDCGFAKTRLVHPVTGMDMLKTAPISQSQANQRAGRAGREAAGVCYRLYPEASFNALPSFSIPEIQRIDLCQVLLQMLAEGVKDIVHFPWLTKPSGKALKRALQTLYLLGAIDDEQKLTDRGQKMARLPLHPSLSHLLLASESLHCTAEALTAVSLLSAENVFVLPSTEKDKQRAIAAHKIFASADGDLCTMINIYNAWIAAKKDIHWTRRNFFSLRALRLANNIRDQLLSLLRSLKISGIEDSCWPEREPFLRCLVQGLYLNIAQRVQGQGNQNTTSTGLKVGKVVSANNLRSLENSSMNDSTEAAKKQLFSVGRQPSMQQTAPYQTLRGHQPVHIHPTSVLFALPAKRLPACVIYAELLTTTKQYMRTVNVIDASWLPEIMPQVFKANQMAASVDLNNNANSASSATVHHEGGNGVIKRS